MSKSDKSGWVRHRGGECPVEAGTLAEVRNRAGDIALKDGASCTSVSWHWSHDNHPGDIMAYKIHKPAEQPDEHDLTRAPKPAPSLAQQADTMLAIRDRIRELDTERAEVDSTYQRQISEITQERESLVQRLAGEGLALVEVVVQPVEDMSDWRNWRAGDFIRHAAGDWRDFTQGKLYRLTAVEDRALFLDDDVEPRTLSVDEDTLFSSGEFPAFKWHSRPAT